MAPALRLGILSVLMLLNGVALAQLNASYYSNSCPNLAYTVRSKVRQAVRKEARMGASLLRLHFHDCFVNGCDGSILLDDTSSFTGEKTAGPNNNSVRGFDVIDTVKSAVESACPGVVSCADILALIAREAVLALGGPTWTVYYGRRDSTTASFSSANSDIPTPSSSVSELTSKFSAKGLSVTDLVALSGAHTLGQARCANFRNRLYNFSGSGQADPNLLQAYATSLKSKCPSSGSDNALASLDLKTPNYFDNKYYSNLQAKKGLLNSDQVLYTTSGNTNTLVNSYATNPSRFLNDFKSAMVNLGNISPLTGSAGQIRKTCRFVNSS